MKKMFQKFLSLSALERKGVIALVAIILVLTGVNIYLEMSRTPEVGEPDPRLAAELRMFESRLQHVADSVTKNAGFDMASEVRQTVTESFVFDPNHAGAADLRRLGMNNRLVSNILKYREHGGKFYRKDDLNKIYGMSAEQYNRLEPYIKIEERVLKAGGGKTEKTEIWFSDINQADSVLLEKLPGIGPVLSQRIVKYRNRLGGFYETEQLKEVYGLSDSVYNQIVIRLYADTVKLKKINLNEATEHEMALHPYIGRYTARAIVLYRNKVVRINKLDELIINGLLTEKQLDKLKRYLEI